MLFNFCIPTNGEQQFTKFQSDCIIFDDADCVNMLQFSEQEDCDNFLASLQQIQIQPMEKFDTEPKAKVNTYSIIDLPQAPVIVGKR